MTSMEHSEVVNVGSPSEEVIVNGLLCSILKAVSRVNNDSELAAMVNSAVLEPEIREAWQKLFSHFRNVLDDNRKIPIIDIKRQTTKLMLEEGH